MMGLGEFPPDVMREAEYWWHKDACATPNANLYARAILAERSRIEKLLKDPVAVRANFLKGQIDCQLVVDEATRVERQRCAARLEAFDGYFNVPEGFYEALYGNTTDDGDGFRVRTGDTGYWAAFMIEILKPFADAIRKGGE